MRALYKFSFLTLLVITIYSLQSFAQISVPGTPLSFSNKVTEKVETYTMPSFDMDKMLREDAFESQFKDIPPRFGKDFEVSFGIENSGTFDVLSNGTKIWRLSIKSPGAVAINLQFDKFELPKGSTFFIYSKDRKQVFGAYTDINNLPEKVFATTPCKGDEIILEYNAPLGMKNPSINVSKVVHAYKNIFDYMNEKGYGSSGSCNRNVFCPDADPYRNQVRSVAMIINQSGVRWCTGSMINNTKNNGTPFFLTANHCISSQNVSNWVFIFKYEAPSCPYPGGDGPLTFSLNGATLLANNSHSDFALLLLSSKPPPSYNIYYNGWNRSNIPATGGVCIHHPAGDVKKISYAMTPYTPTSYNNPSIPGDSSHWHVTWTTMPGSDTIAVTEGGSSGSPVFDQNKRIVGQLHGGPSSCTASDKSDYYGKFDRSWNYGSTPATRLREWLDSLGTNPLYIDGFDPNAGPLNAFNILLPSSGITITSVPGSSTPISFDWDTSSLAATYKWIFGTSLPVRQLTIPVFPRPMVLTLGQLDTYLASIGLNQGDSISGSWDVWAFRNNAPQNDSLKATNGPRTIKFKRQKPLLTTFSLVSPVSNTTIPTQAGVPTPVKFNWSRSGAGVVYKMLYASPNFSSQANIKFRITSDNTGFDTVLTSTQGALDALLAGIGVAPGDSSVGQWRVYAYSGNDSLASTQTNAVTFKRVPIGSFVIGTGTTSSQYPFTTFWHDARTQLIYSRGEILAAGGNGNLITSIGFNVLAQYPLAMQNFTIKMQNFSDSSLTGYIETGNWVTVYQNTSGYSVPGTGWQMIQLTTPFPYNINKNLLIDICFDNTTYTTSSTVASTSGAPYDNRQFNRHMDNGAGCTMSSTSGTAYTTGRPNITLVMNLASNAGNNTMGVPLTYSLSQNYPNPFNPVTKINFAVPKQSLVTLKVYDMLGREVKMLVNEIKTTGFYSVDFNASEFASGVYFYRLETDGFTDVKRMVLIK